MTKTHLLVSVLLLASAVSPVRGSDLPSWQVVPVIRSAEQLFPQGEVRLLEGPFKAMQDMDLAYLMRLEPDRLLAQFRVEAGLEPKARPYGGWEAPPEAGKTWSVAGHSLGHYLSAISLMHRLTEDYRLKERVAYISRELKECQDKHGDGMLAAFPKLRELAADIRSGKVESVDKYWAPFYTIHKELAGLRDAWVWCGDSTSKEVLIRLADWCGSLVKDLSDERRERFLQAEHGGMAEALADVYAVTGDQKYLEYARLYSHRALLDPLADGQDNLTGKHANTQVPKFIGFQRIHELSGESRPGAAAAFFWQTVVKNRTWVNGGNSMHEHFPAPGEMGKLIPNDGGPETCNTYNMLRLTEALYREKPSAAYIEYYENALFNHILGSQAPLMGAGAFVYYTPLRPDFARSYGTDFHSFWCCTGTGMENHARYGQFIYAHDNHALTVNLFIASEVNWRERGLSLRQETRFPDETASVLVITQAPELAVTLRIRHPSWLEGDKFQLKVNGIRTESGSQPGGYAAITRTWQAGDRVDISLPIKPRVVRHENTPGWVSFFYGPVLLVGELGAEGTTQPDYVGPYTPVKALRLAAKAPVVIAEHNQDLVAALAPIPGRPASFRTKALVKPADVTLSPLFRTHFQRYAMYWEVSDLQSWERKQREAAEAERLERELEMRTVDRIRIGEQQPEIDHNLQFERSETGTGPEGRRWRHATEGGWFSYEMKVPAANAPVSLYVSYWGLDEGREFDIQVDGKTIATESLRRGKDSYFGAEYSIPGELLAGREKVTVRFQAKAGKMAGGVFDVRVVNTK